MNKEITRALVFTALIPNWELFLSILLPEGRQDAVLTLVLAVSAYCLMLSYVLSYAVLCWPVCYLWYHMLSCAVLCCIMMLSCAVRYAHWWSVLAILPLLCLLRTTHNLNIWLSLFRCLILALYHLMLSLKSVVDVWAITQMYLWMVFVATKIDVCPPNPPWKWYSSADASARPCSETCTFFMGSRALRILLGRVFFLS